jgi:benzoyl-CoA reductase/2-hydroxyglutaryl-CoA dehydratase subunit BcrC/BadD/HgdB
VSEAAIEEYGMSKKALRLLKAARPLYKYPNAVYWLRKLLGDPLLLKETNWNKDYRFAYLLTGGTSLSPEDNRAVGILLEDLYQYLEAYVNPSGPKKPMIWSEWNLSNEILRVFDVNAYIPETLAVLGHLGGTDAAVKIIEEAENAGLPPEYCSAAKCAVGGYLLNESPKPDAIITSSHPCDSVVSSYQALEKLTGAPMFVMDTPYWKDEDSYLYYADQLYELIGFLEKVTGQKMDWEKLKQVCRTVNATNAHLQEISEMCRAVPAPASSLHLLFHWLGRMACFGSPAGEQYAKIMHANAKKRFEQGKGYLKEEKVRVIWYDVPVVFEILHPWMEKEFGAVVVADFIGRIEQFQIDTSTTESMIRDLAKTHMSVTMARQTHGPAEFYTQELKRLIEEYSPDCFIFVRHQGCKGGWAAMKLIREQCQKTGLPALFLNTDIFDRRVVSSHRIREQVTNFFRSNNLA